MGGPGLYLREASIGDNTVLRFFIAQKVLSAQAARRKRLHASFVSTQERQVRIVRAPGTIYTRFYVLE